MMAFAAPFGGAISLGGKKRIQSIQENDNKKLFDLNSTKSFVVAEAIATIRWQYRRQKPQQQQQQRLQHNRPE